MPVKDYGPNAALTVAILIGILWAQGGIPRTIASIILLAVLITPVNGRPAILEGLLTFSRDVILGEKPK